jgi:hypothetical protein
VDTTAASEGSAAIGPCLPHRLASDRAYTTRWDAASQSPALARPNSRSKCFLYRSGNANDTDDNPTWPTPATIDGNPVHSALALIPLMTEGELEGLAASIKHLGQMMPIMLDGEVVMEASFR